MKRLHYIMLCLLLMAAGMPTLARAAASVDTGEQSLVNTVSIRTTAVPTTMRYNISGIAGQEQWSQQTAVALQETVIAEAHEQEDWTFDYWADSLGNVLSRNYRLQFVATQDTLLVAHYKYDPVNPGYLPHGTYDPATGLLSVEVGVGDLYATINSLTKIHNISGEEVRTVSLSGTVLENEYIDLYFLYRFPNLQTLDLSGLNNWKGLSESWALSSKSFKEIILPADIDSLGDNALAYCDSLTSVVLNSIVPPGIDLTAFNGVNKDSLVVTVPAASLPDYQAHPIWGTFNLQANGSVELKTLTVRLGQTLPVAGGRVVVANMAGVTTDLVIRDTTFVYNFQLPNQQDYIVRLLTALGAQAAIDTITLESDTTILLTPAGIVQAQLYVSSAEGQSLNQVVNATWINAADSTFLGTGLVSPYLSKSDSVIIRVQPTGDAAAYYQSIDQLRAVKDTICLTLPLLDQPLTERPAELFVYCPQSPAGGIAILYHQQKQTLIGRYYLDGEGTWRSAEISQLQPGSYTMYVFNEQDPNSNIMNSSILLTLTAEDCFIDTFSLQSGDYVRRQVFIPSYTNPAPEAGVITAQLSLSKTTGLVGDYSVLCFDADFRQSPAAQAAKSIYYQLYMPHELSIVDGSVVVGKLPLHLQASDSIDAQTKGYLFVLTMPNVASVDDTRLRCCVQATSVGDFPITGFVNYATSTSGSQPNSIAGSVTYSARTITIKAPSSVLYPAGQADVNIHVSGLAPVGAAVSVLDQYGYTVATAQANGFGQWSAVATVSTADSLTSLVATAVNNVVTLVSDTAQISLRPLADIYPQTAGFTHYNTYYNRPMPVEWNMQTCATSVRYYYYYVSADFTYTTQFAGVPDSVIFVVTGLDGTIMQFPAEKQQQGTNSSVWTAVRNMSRYQMPVRVDLIYFVDNSVASYHVCSAISAIGDPSGYVYEAVSSNRLEGVTATAYTKTSATATETLWNAAYFDQVNPLQTDYAGRYAWDVPAGLWQVRFSKTGYEPMQTEWMPVPPPQLEINLPMTRLSAPQVQSFQAFEDSAVITFDRYMLPADMTTAKIQVSEVPASALTGHITLLDNEARTAGDSVSYVSRIAFKADRAFQTQQLALTIAANQVHSYAGIPMAAYSTTANHEMEVKKLLIGDTLRVVAGQSANAQVNLQPAAAAAGKTLTADALGSALCTVSASQTVSAAGIATVAVQGHLPGTTQVKLNLQGTDLQAYLVVVVSPAPVVQPIPTALDASSTSASAQKAQKQIENGRVVILLDGKKYNTIGQEIK